MRNDAAAADCEDLVKVYRTAASSVYALRGITATFPVGALTAVAGPSGSGKSSLLKLLAGMDRPTAGRLVVEGLAVNRARASVVRRLRRAVGYVFQRASDNFLPHLTIREHLEIARGDRTAAPRVGEEELCALLGISDRLDHLPSQLSGGEQARAALAPVVAGGASLVIVDEPTSELDSATAELVLGAMRALVDRGVTFVVATHDALIIRAADHLIELDHGVVRKRVRADRDVRVATEVGTVSSRNIVGERRAIVQIEGLEKSYRRGTETVHAVRDVTVSLSEGELVGLIGRSGSGKTTLLNMIAGWERPEAGTVSVEGADPFRTPPPWRAVAVVPQRLGLIEELTIRENAEYPARLNASLHERAGLVDELLEMLELTGLERRFPREVSVGEQQRAAIARALVLSPRLLLVDEPTGHQDPTTAGKVFDALRRAVDEGTCCIAATHDDHATSYLDRRLSMSDGMIAEWAG